MGDALKQNYGEPIIREGEVFENLMRKRKHNEHTDPVDAYLYAKSYMTDHMHYEAGGDDEPVSSQNSDDGEWLDVHFWMNKDGEMFSPYPYDGMSDMLKFDGLMRTRKINKDGSCEILDSDHPDSIAFWNKIRERYGVQKTVSMTLKPQFSKITTNNETVVKKHNPDGSVEYLGGNEPCCVAVVGNTPHKLDRENIGEVAWGAGLMKQDRPTKIDYYLDMASCVAKRGTCLRRNYGSIIVKDDRIVSTGYTGAPRGRQNCCDIGHCVRAKNNIPRGERYELCRSVHSEMNAIINASPEEMKDATLYLVGIEHDTDLYVDNPNCCAMCKRAVINAGIKHVIVRNKDQSYRIINVSDWIKS